MQTTRLLAINFGGLGDEILFLPTLKSIRDAHPNWHITLLCEPRSKSIFELTNLIDDIITFDIKKIPLLPNDLISLLILIRKGKFDIVVSSGSSYLVSMLLFLSGIKTRIGYYSGPLSKLLLSHAQPLNKEQYAASMYHDLVKGLGIQGQITQPAITVAKDSTEKINKLLPIEEKRLFRIVLHPGTSKLAIKKGIIKTWAADNWTDLIKHLLLKQNVQVVLAGGPDDDEIISTILDKLKASNVSLTDTNNFVLVYGKTKNIADLAALIESCQLLICLDSAPMHIGVALNKSLIAMFGPTDPKKLLPKNNRFIVINLPIEASAILQKVNEHLNTIY